MRFIELHEALNGTPIAINADLVCSVKPYEWFDGTNRDGAYVALSERLGYPVREPYNDVLAVISAVSEIGNR